LNEENTSQNTEFGLDGDFFTFGDEVYYVRWRTPELSTNLDIHSKDHHKTESWYIRHYYDFDTLWTRQQADIIDAKSEMLVWCPPETQDIRWFRGGSEIIVLRLFDRESSHCLPEYRGMDVYERYSWPEKVLLGRCRIKTPLPGASKIVGSPRGDLVIVQWWHQGEAGLEFVEIDDVKGDSRLIQPGFTWEALEYRSWFEYATSGVPADEFMCTEPVFSPSGQYIAFGQHDGQNIILLDWDNKELRKVYLSKSEDSWYYLPPSPEGLPDDGYKHMDHITFITEQLVEVIMTSGWRQLVNIA
jgi:hypothetical protein